MKSPTIEAILKLDKERGGEGGREREEGLGLLGSHLPKGHGMGAGDGKDRRWVRVTSDRRL